MKYFVTVVMIVFIASCNGKNKGTITDRTKRVEVKLMDSLGIVSFNNPERYDTSFSWTHYSDCNTCHKRKYRFQPKNTPILKESGWIWDKPKDSVDRFTISHKASPPLMSLILQKI